MMKITKRVVDVKRHTKGYIVDGKRMPRGAVVKQARRGKVDGVVACKGGDGWYITSRPSHGRPLYGLPEVVEKT